jgi:hypothetical protein
MLLKEAYYVELLQPRHKIVFETAVHVIVLYSKIKQR